MSLARRSLALFGAVAAWAFAWTWPADHPQMTAFLRSLVGGMLVAPSMILFLETGRGLARWWQAPLAALGATGFLLCGWWLATRAAPTAAIATAAGSVSLGVLMLWAAERFVFRGATHGFLATLLATAVWWLPFGLDAFLEVRRDPEFVVALRDGTLEASPAVWLAAEHDLDPFKNEGFYTWRPLLGEQPVRYARAPEGALGYLMPLGGLAVLAGAFRLALWCMSRVMRFRGRES